MKETEMANFEMTPEQLAEKERLFPRDVTINVFLLPDHGARIFYTTQYFAVALAITHDKKGSYYEFEPGLNAYTLSDDEMERVKSEMMDRYHMTMKYNNWEY